MLVQIINDTISIFQMNVKEKSNLSSEPNCTEFASQHYES